METPMKKIVMGRPSQLALAGRVMCMASACVLAAGVLATGLAGAQETAVKPAQPRIQAEINTGQESPLKGSLHPLAQSRFDAGRMPANTELHGMTIFFNRSAEQEKEMKALIAAQQNSSSPEFHKWLTPEQFGERFGMAQEDIAKVRSWLESEGFRIDSVNRASTGIHFSGTAAQVERAFATEMHYYNVNGEKRFAPATALSAPSAIAGAISGIGNLHDFHPRPLHIRAAQSKAPALAQSRLRARKQYTINSDGTQYVYFAPGDIDVAYDINSLVSGGNDGTGQTITILGQSAIQLGDITNFQQGAGLTVKNPTLTLVPGTGTSTLNPGCANGGSSTCGGDEGESDLDIEWAGATAPGATINFVYTGGATVNGAVEYGVYDSYQYAVDNAVGNIINFSYGSCETEMSQSDYDTLEAIGSEAVLQGQSVLAASGDQGSTACSGYTDLTTAQQEALAVNYPASSQYVTGVGGTEISSDNAQVGTYWSSASNDSISLTTALSYIPEIAWNDDDSQYGLSSSGGGASTFTARPSWQTGVTGIPSGTQRLVPDVSLYASPNYPGFLFCSSDEYDWDVQDGQAGSCGSSELYWSDTENGYVYFTLAGGTSFASPIFAGMLAIVNQAKGYTNGQGLVNTELYKLASNSTTYASAFHDITSGNNKCSAGSSYCSSSSPGFTTNAGYDEVTGLGSVDLANLVAAWPANGVTVLDTTTTVTAANTSPTVGTADSFTVTVTPASGSTAPTGTVAVTDNGTAITGSPFALTASGANATATFSYTFTASGSHTVSVSYSGDSDFNASTGSVTLTATGTTTSVATTTTVTASSTVPTVGTADSFTVTVTPASGSTAPTGTVSVTDNGTAITGSPFTLTASGSNATATFSYTFTAAGSHTVAASYSGDANFSTSSGSATLSPTAPTNPTSFTIQFQPTSLTLSQGNSGTESLLVTPTDYVGTVNLTYDTSNDTALANLCVFAVSGFASNGSSIVVSSAATAVTGVIEVDTNASDCASSNAVAAMALKGRHLVSRSPRTLLPAKSSAKNSGAAGPMAGPIASGAALAGLLLMGFFGRQSKKLRGLAMVLLLAGIGLAISACGGSSGGSSSTPDPAKGTYTITFSGVDSGSSSINATGSFSLTID